MLTLMCVIVLIGYGLKKAGTYAKENPAKAMDLASLVRGWVVRWDWARRTLVSERLAQSSQPR